MSNGTAAVIVAGIVASCVSPEFRALVESAGPGLVVLLIFLSLFA